MSHVCDRVAVDGTAADLDLTVSQARVLGSLFEKELVTPNAYPTTLNALVGACNQLSNRDPVLKLEPHQVETAALTLKSKGLLRVVYPGSGERSTRYRQLADEVLGLDEAQRALICLLLLRGPQTVAELRARSERLHPFREHSGVESALADLARREQPLVARTERLAGQKEGRWAQLLETDSARRHLARDRRDEPEPPAAAEPHTSATAWAPPRESGDSERTAPAGAAAAFGIEARHESPEAPDPSLEALESRLAALEARFEALLEALGDLVDPLPG